MLDLKKLIDGMTVEEKIGQLAQFNANVFSGSDADITGPLVKNGLTGDDLYRIGSLLNFKDSKEMNELQKRHLEGDRNTKYFHRISKIKTATKTITSLQDGDIVHIDPEHISNHVVSYYKNLFCSNLVLQEPLLVQEVTPKLISDDTNALLYAAFSSDRKSVV